MAIVCHLETDAKSTKEFLLSSRGEHVDNYIDTWSNSDFSKSLSATLGTAVVVTDHSIAGEGNMNYTYRLSLSDGGSLIAKQSPPFCSKFPSIPASRDRIFSEILYFGLVARSPGLSAHSPKLHGSDRENRLLFMEDLGAATDFEHVYQGLTAGHLAEKTLVTLIRYLKNLHALQIEPTLEFENIEMRQLNHAYIFDLPFDSTNGSIDLDTITPGLQTAASSYKCNQKLRAAALELGADYLNEKRVHQRTLIHGDFYPKSWIETSKGLYVIDPEFGFIGRAEIDLGFFLAHMLLSKKFDVSLRLMKTHYGHFDETFVARYCAVEVLRRLLFVAQLPLARSLVEKVALLEMGATALISGNLAVLKDIA